MGTHPIFESDFDCLTATHPDSHEAPKMPGVQDNYSIDVTNRFGFAGIDVDSGNDDAIENVDPFAVLNDLKQQAEIAKSLPKKKVQKKAAPVKAAEPEKKLSDVGAKAEDAADAETDDNEATDHHASDANREAERLRELLVKTAQDAVAEEVDAVGATVKIDELATENPETPELLTRATINEMVLELATGELPRTSSWPAEEPS